MKARSFFLQVIGSICIIVLLTFFLMNNIHVTAEDSVIDRSATYATVIVDDSNSHYNSHQTVAVAEANDVTTDQNYVLNQSGGGYITTSSGRRIYCANSGNTIQDVINNLRYSDYEIVCGFDANGNKMFDYTSYQHNLAYTTNAQRSEFYNNGGTIVAHNHPSGSSFSGQDLYAEAIYDTPCAMVISKDYVYIAEPTNVAWDDATAIHDYWQASFNYHINYLSDYVYSHPYNRQAILNSPDTPDDGSVQWFCQHEIKTCLQNNSEVIVRAGIWASHRAMLDLAGHFNIEYYRYPIDEFDPAVVVSPTPVSKFFATEIVYLD